MVVCTDILGDYICIYIHVILYIIYILYVKLCIVVDFDINLEVGAGRTYK